MWTLILERTFYLLRIAGKDVDRAVSEWRARSEHESWYARQIHRKVLCELRHDFTRGLPMIRTLIAVCPMLGLLGTVVGMLEVFDVMAINGSSNVRGLASGVSQATFSTMAGMVAALSGLVISVRLDRWAHDRVRTAAELMSS
ncbi:MAG: MotA/TolQ/ExbB proton channel family protein [Myxococcales bacterium]|nr:MotA/TolQ/ExbB proton channel family protein [Myxococcales bacterium]